MDAKALSAAAGAKVAREPTAGAVRRQVLARVMRDARDSPKADVRVRALTLAGDLARTMPDVPGLGRAVMERLLREIDHVEPKGPRGSKKAPGGLTAAQRTRAMGVVAELARTLPETLDPDVLAGGSSEGQRLLNILLAGTSQHRVASRVGVTQPAVRGWQAGALPGADVRVRLERVYEIPISSWDEPERPPPPRAPAEVLADLHLDRGFYEFATKCGEGYPFTAAQAAIAKVCFGGQEPGDLVDDEREAARELFGAIDIIPGSARRTIALEIGRHGGKTSITAWFVVFRLLTADISKMFRSTVPKFAILAPRVQTTKQLYDQAVTLLLDIPAVKDRMRVQNDEQTIFVRPTDGRVVGIEVYPRSPAGRAVRGQDFVGFAVDEAEFGEKHAKGEGIISDADQIDAARPRLRGPVIMLSSFWPAPSYMRDVVQHNWRKPSTALVARGKTLMMRRGGLGYEEVAAERAAMLADPLQEAAGRREFDLEGEDVEELFYEASLVEDAIDPDISPATGRNVSAGMDLGFRLDWSALVITERQGSRLVVVACYVRKPEKGRALDPEIVTREFAELARHHGAQYVCADNHCSDQTEKACRAAGIVAVILDRTQLTPAADQTRVLLVQHRLVIPHPGETRPELEGAKTLARELKAIRTRPGPGGTVEFVKPRVTGAGHCDAASALEMAAYDDNRRFGPFLLPARAEGPRVPVGIAGSKFSVHEYLGSVRSEGWMRK